jgi:post-segregation antitoxin (ccd killing protein)
MASASSLGRLPGALPGRKDRYIFTAMGQLINVRLDDEHLRRVQALRARGIVISDLVRDAIDARYEALAAADEKPVAATIVAALFEQHPDQPGRQPRDYDVHDRRAAREAIRARRTRKRP